MAQVGDHGGLGDFEAKLLRRHAAVLDLVDEEIRETGIGKRLAREVDAAGADLVADMCLVQCQHPEGVLDDPAVYGGHQ